MLTITLHAPNSHCNQLYIDNLNVPLVELLQKLIPDLSLEHTDIALDRNFKNIIAIDEKTKASTVFPDTTELSEIDLYLRPRFPSRIQTRRGAIAPQSIEYGDGLILFNQSGTIARPNTPESDEASSSQMPSVLTIEPKNQKQKIIEEFGTKLIQLVGEQLDGLLELFVNIVRSYTPQTDLESYFNIITEFLQANTNGELQQAQSLIVEYAEKIASIDEESPAALPKIGSNDYRVIAKLAERAINEEISAITTRYNAQSKNPLLIAILQDRENVINRIAKRVIEDLREYYELSDICLVVSKVLDTFLGDQDMPTASLIAALRPEAASAPPPDMRRAANHLEFFPPSPSPAAASNASPNTPPGDTPPASPTPAYSGSMEDVD